MMATDHRHPERSERANEVEGSQVSGLGRQEIPPLRSFLAAVGMTGVVQRQSPSTLPSDPLDTRSSTWQKAQPSGCAFLVRAASGSVMPQQRTRRAVCVRAGAASAQNWDGPVDAARIDQCRDLSAHRSVCPCHVSCGDAARTDLGAGSRRRLREE